MALPNGFVDLAKAYTMPPNSFINIMGVVVDLMPTKPLYTGQHTMTFKLLDTAFRDSVQGNQINGLTVRFFKHDASKLPDIRSIGDVVLIRDIKMTNYRDQPVAISTWNTEPQVFPASSIPDPKFSIAYQGNERIVSRGAPQDTRKLSLQEQAYVISLKSDLSSSVAASTISATEQNKKREPGPLPPNLAPPMKKPRSSTSSFGPKFQLVEELEHMRFANICGEVVKKFSNPFGQCELYLTDYTQNKNLFYYAPPEEEEQDGSRDGDIYAYNQPTRKGWPGPYGWQVLKVNLSEPHSRFADQRVKEGDLVLLQNVKIKIGTYSANPHLEGDMWPDNLSPDKVLVQIIRNHQRELPEVKALEERKKKYEHMRKSKQPKREEEQKPSKMEKKRLKKQRQKEEKEKAKASTEDQTADDNPITQPTKPANGCNPHIRCSHEETPLTSLRDILDVDNIRHKAKLGGEERRIPFINANYRIQARVVDFEPSAIEDFAVPAIPDAERELSPIDMEFTQPSTPGYEWFFSLLLEEDGGGGERERERIWVHLQHEEAQYLLGREMEDPQDLRKAPQLLAKLRERLCILWGNLEEKGPDEPISNRPFECCVQEYGQEMDEEDEEKALVPMGWKRLYRLSGTTIL
ncbi:hypothetical protein D0864_14401 [Hortaea werneckii]|uniref:Protection of telomeres protein 1 n=1 Tax=Hortaea werneckii TaxID=91943 RepID=A0A3M7CHJ4_HORWE|nr:hypothetical protein KC338_g3651 [Hortaea werneckii]KAI7353236.1 hypothetical protein KC320_g4033 [Hortaea werneckii]RMY51525.1 hypothetical protein D0864_14401 [Hortaea werneckii]RMY90492.1 hypothetical protein D0862_09949 [Hortaea werneckii]